ncbi:MAG TPA: UDP-N-acetylmuramate dehydrogenase [Gallionellaceae bacterium]|nr:UDP-N-acetylmuramate dehydrogenase [Gallionellaceae bacterium]
MDMTEAIHLTTEGLRGKLREDVDMRRHTSWNTGGHAERMYQPADLDDLVCFLRTRPADEPLMAVGLGSNLLVRDGGLRGTVLLLHAALTELRLEHDGTIYAQAGVPGAKLARFAANNNLRGAEFFAGIPGTVGGMLAMNAGCYGSETWNVVQRVQTVDRSGLLHERMPVEYEIGYRHLQRQKEQADINSDAELFVGAWFRLEQGDGEISRKEIKSLLSKRITSQPLNLPNAGSVFRNPPGDHAARLIEASGLKGLKIGGAQVSEKHANFIVNLGNATAADIENLISEVRTVVQQKTGITLHPEVRIVGVAAENLTSNDKEQIKK